MDKINSLNVRLACSINIFNASETHYHVLKNKEPAPEGQRDKEIYFSQFILSLFDGVGKLLPGDFAGLLMSRPRLLAAGDSFCQKVLQRFSLSIQGALF